ncbi:MULTISPECIES: alkaline phosphatase family protein [Helcococcus]|uniref:Ectonucleotide pyrophosphatase/phosphodiesterase n=2 Tax=Helcococcus bovis TaxID=3153252 RepID=A0ABW9F5F0_9FIRM
MVKKDFEFFKTLPNFKKLIENSSYSINVKSVNSTLTYVCHSSIITGCYPINHKVNTNTLLQENRIDSPDWYRKYIKRETVYDLAIKNKMKVANLLWPVTAKSKITWNMPEIWANRKWKNQKIISAFSGNLRYQLELDKNFGHIRDGKNQPNLDHFTTAGICYTIKKYRPDLLLSHLIDLDSMRHYYGHDSKEAKDSIVRLDRRLGE